MAAVDLQCSAPGCIAIRDDAPRRAWEDPQLCAKHRQDARARARVCLNCAAPLVQEAELNNLTGRPLRRQGEVVLTWRCLDACGYTRRARR